MHAEGVLWSLCSALLDVYMCVGEEEEEKEEGKDKQDNDNTKKTQERDRKKEGHEEEENNWCWCWGWAVTNHQLLCVVITAEEKFADRAQEGVLMRVYIRLMLPTGEDGRGVRRE